MFHFTNKHSERETDHVVFAFHLHVPCSETVLASRLVLLVILVFVLLFFIFVLFFSLHICPPGDFGICPVVFYICPVFFFIFVLLVILVFVLLFFIFFLFFSSYLSSWWFWYLSCCFLYLSWFFSSYLSSWWLWSRLPEGEDCKMKLIRSPFQRCRGRDSSGQRSFRCGRSRCWNTFQTTLKRDTMRPSNKDFFSFIGEQTWNDRICKCFTRARLQFC